MAPRPSHKRRSYSHDPSLQLDDQDAATQTPREAAATPGLDPPTPSDGFGPQGVRRRTANFSAVGDIGDGSKLDLTSRSTRFREDMQEASPGKPVSQAAAWLKFLHRRRWILAAIVVWFVANRYFAHTIPADQQPLSPEEISNQTLQENAFFKDQLLFSGSGLLDNMTASFVGRFFAPGEHIQRHGEPAHFVIIENGTAHLVATNAEDEVQHREGYRHGDSHGGMNILYNKLCDHDMVAGASGAYVWVADKSRLLAILESDVILMAALERKFVRSLVQKRSKKPFLFFPGFASTQLIAWKTKRCVGTNIEIGDRVWLNIQKVLHHNIFEEHCWIKCMSLDILEQTDPIDCKLRPQEGMSAIYDLAGGIFAPFTTIFRTVVFEMANQFGYDISSMAALPYDWRLAPSKLQQRDKFFSRVRQEIELVAAEGLAAQSRTVESAQGEQLPAFSKWRSDLVTIRLDDEDANINATFAVDDVTNGRMFVEIGRILEDEDYVKFNQSLYRYYHQDPIYDPLAIDGPGPARPPIRKILAVYGVNVHTDVGYTYRVGRVHQKRGLRLEEEIYEGPGGRLFVRGSNMLAAFRPLEETPVYEKSGDGVVPYASLSWVNTWHYDNLNITSVPATTRVDLDALSSQLEENLQKIDVAGLLQAVNTVQPAYTKYASSIADSNGDSRDLTVIEIDFLNHRSVIKDLFMVERLEEEIYWQVRKDFLRENAFSHEEPAPVNRILEFFSSVSVKFLDVLYKERSPQAEQDIADAAVARGQHHTKAAEAAAADRAAEIAADAARPHLDHGI